MADFTFVVTVVGKKLSGKLRGASSTKKGENMSYYTDCRELFAKANELSQVDKESLIDYLQKSNKGFEAELEDRDFDWGILFPKFSKEAGAVFTEACDITIAWKLDTEEIINFNNDLIARLKGEQ